MSPSSETDFLIVGAGPAGLAAGLAAAEQGVTVAVLDRKTVVGRPVACAEFVPRLLAREFPLPEEAVSRAIEELETDVAGEVICTSSPGYVLDRDRWEAGLAKKAADLGVRFSLGTTVFAVDGTRVRARCRGRIVTWQGRVLLGADGPSSRVRESLGVRPSPCVLGWQRTYPLPAAERDTRRVRVFFRDYIPAGYGWYFPKAREVNVGVGLEPGFGSLPRKALDRLVAELQERGLLTGEAWTRQAGKPIPSGGAVSRTRKGAVLLAGDAAGHTDPISGAGVAPAVLGGRMAGLRAARFLRGEAAALAGYEKEWRRLWGASLRRGKQRRAWLVADCRAGRPLARIRRCWVAFPEYYR